MSGWVKTHRKVATWEWYKEPNMYHLFSHLILSANHKDGRWKGIDVKRGQVITGRKSLCEQTGISERSIRTCLSKLKATSEVTIKTTSKFSIITICNYEEYQSKEEKSDQQNDQQSVQQPTSDRPATDHKQEVKKGKEVKKVKHGTFDNVLLSLEEFQKLTDKFNGSCQDKIDTLSEYLKSKGAKYKSHYATILSWDRRDKKDNPHNKSEWE